MPETISVKLKGSVHPLFYVGMVIARFGFWMASKFNLVVSMEVENAS